MSSISASTPETSAAFLGREAPRYTSYPSAQHFSAAIHNTHHAAWLAGMEEAASISAYVHIPFCKELCWFCGCHTKMTKRYEPITKYVRVLLQEIELIKRHAAGKGKLVNIHFGGGSPSLLQQNDMLSILYGLASAFTPTPGGELAIELDPRTTTPENIAMYADAGVNRVSVGIQDFTPEVQRAINRVQPYETVANVFIQLRQVGIREINCDLVYGLPHQTATHFRDTLEKTLSLSPARLSLFSYAHMPHIKKHQRLISADWLPTMQEKLELFALATELLTASGYVAIGMDHFAKPEDPLARAMQARTMRRNFQGYVTDASDVLVGIGSSAISQFPQGYAQNSATTADYITRVGSQRLPTTRGWAFAEDDLARKHIIDELMCFMQADIALACQKFSLPANYFAKEMEELCVLAEKGIIKTERSHIALATPYRMAARVVASVFDRYRTVVAGGYSKVA